MSRNRYRQNSLQATIKDYIVPIIWGVILIILLYSFLSGWDTVPQNTSENENQTPTTISLENVDTEAFIVYPSDEKVKIQEWSVLYKGEKVIVKEWSVRLASPTGTQIHLNKIAELAYKEDGDYSLYASDVWFTLTADTSISMSYANIDAPSGSIIALTQNEASSTIYVLSGSAKVSNLAGLNTLLISGQKISVTQANAMNKDMDLANEKTNIDSYFKWSDWFIENKGHLILEQESLNTPSTESSSWSQSTWDTGAFISFDTLRDEMSVTSSSIDITWKILSSEIGSITINNTQATISQANKTFTLAGLSLRNSVNDIVIKIYNTDKDILQKKVYTVYSSSQNTSTNTTPVNTSFQWVTTYEVDATKFGFTEPSDTGKFSTSADEITIRGFTTAEWISKVQVNGFPLASFNGSTWRYHAFKRFETLEEGTNQYKVDYFGEDGSIVYSDYYTIVKKAASAINTTNSPETTWTATTWTPGVETSTETPIPEETTLFAD